MTSKRSAKTMGIQTTVDHSGAVRIVRSKQKGSLPQGTEELRAILKIEGNTWCFLSAKFRNREILRNMRPSCWEEYTNFLLGERCYLMKIHGGKGADASPLRPPWHILLSFEFELRKEAIKRALKENKPIAQTLQDVCKDPELKERFFTSPIALQPQALEPGFLKRAWSGNGFGKGNGWPSDVPFNKWGRKGKEGKSNYKGFKGFKEYKGTGKKGGNNGKPNTGGQSANSLIDRTPDGREVCFAFNAQGCDGSCGRVRICRVRGCGAAHAMWEHFQKLSLGDASTPPARKTLTDKLGRRYACCISSQELPGKAMCGTAYRSYVQRQVGVWKWRSLIFCAGQNLILAAHRCGKAFFCGLSQEVLMCSF